MHAIFPKSLKPKGMADIFERFDHLEKQILCTQKTILNIDEVCALTSLSKSTIYKLTMAGKIPHFKKAKHLYFDRIEIEFWLKEHRGYYEKEAFKIASNALSISK
jgi:excisionase family DNA binding protein